MGGRAGGVELGVTKRGETRLGVIKRDSKRNEV